MTNSKNTKKALYGSILSMIVCLAMLIGSTFAWFTDSVVSGNNKIVAGNLDVELEYTTTPNDEESWEKVDEYTNLFKPSEGEGATLWEPGHTEYVYLKIKNVGSLALKYQLTLNVFADANGMPEKSYTSVLKDENGNNKKFRLSDYLVFRQFDATKTINSREDLWIKNVEDEKTAMGKLDEFGEEDVLLPNGEGIIMLAVYMPTSVGNDANQLTSAKDNEGVPNIFLGLNLQATQTPHENDSFNQNYDIEAPIETYEVTTANIDEYLSGQHGSMSNAELKLAPGNYNLKIGEPSPHKNGGTIYECPNGTDHPNQAISFTDVNQYQAHLADNKWHFVPNYVTTIENLTIVGSEGVTVNGLNISSGHRYNPINNPVLGNTQQYYFMQNIKNLTFKNVSFNAKVNIDTSHANTVIDGVTFDNCTFETGITNDANTGQALRFYNESNNGKVRNLVVKDCTFRNSFQGVYTMQVNGVSVTNCTFNSITHNAIALQSQEDKGPTNHKKVNIQDNTFEGINDSIIRFNHVGADTHLTIKNNTATNSGDLFKRVIRATSIVDGITYDISNNSWGEGTSVSHDEFRDQ